MTDRTCSIEDCESTVHARGWCKRHYFRHRRTRPDAVICSVDGCERATQARGLCGTHYSRWRRTGSADLPQFERGLCVIDGCTNELKARGWCSAHYFRWRKYGDPEEPPKKVRLYCTVEDCSEPAHGDALCNTHYRRMARNDTLTVRTIGGVVDGQKVCAACKISKPVSEFGVNRALPTGRHIYCKLCTNEISAAYRVLIGADVVNAQARAARQKHPRYWAVGNHARRARIFGRENELVIPTVVFDRDGWVCQICFVPVARVVRWPNPLYATVDHIIPLARGGHHLYSNCQTACWACNFAKGARMT